MSTHSRRDFLLKSGLGLGGAALTGLLPGGGMLSFASAADLIDPLAPKSGNFPAKIKSVIWLHMDGAPSTLDLYDYKPDLIKLNGQDVAAGSYALYTIPGEDEWTIILNQGVGKSGTQYDEKEDVLRFKTSPLPFGTTLETFTIEFNRITEDSAVINLVW